MNKQRYEYVRELFLAALDMEYSARADYLDRSCGKDTDLRIEVESLLDHVEVETPTSLAIGRIPAGGLIPAIWEASSAGDDAEREFGSELSGMEAAIRDRAVPATIGRYAIIEVLGAGGMGIVYLAEQDNPRRRVALKVVRSSVASDAALRRFQLEAQVLGRLQHPGIAHIYEAGIDDSGSSAQPFFAMELIEGTSVTEFADRNRLGIRARLELIAKIADAVHHAHTKSVIHRDLKPGNILVTESGQPKILDFGVARATDCDLMATTAATSTGQLVGTLQYMSPEQVSGRPEELDTRSDVFALGVISYELLSGQPPHAIGGKSIAEAIRTIAEHRPARLGTMNKALRGDIETIVAKALEPDKDRRYGSASDLAADIRRFLCDEPISARPASTMYQVTKFTRRHKLLVGGVCALLVALGWGLLESLRAEREFRNRLVEVQRETAKVRAINEFLNDMLGSPVPEHEGHEVRVVDFLQRAADQINTRFDSQPLIEASLRSTIGLALLRLGLFSEAEPHLRRTVDLSARFLEPDHEETLAAKTNLARALEQSGQLEESEKLVRHVWETRQETLGTEHLSTLKAQTNLAALLQAQGKHSEAEPVVRQAVATLRRVAGDDHEETLIAVNNFSELLVKRGAYDQAVALLVPAIDRMSERWSAEHPVTLAAKGNLASAYGDLKRFTEAEGLYRDLLDTRRRTMSEDHPATLTTLSNLADVMRSSGRHEAAQPLFEEAFEAMDRTLGSAHVKTLIALNNLAMCQVDAAAFADAEGSFAELELRSQKGIPKNHWLADVFLRNRGVCFLRQGRLEEAERTVATAHENLSRKLGDTHPQTQNAVAAIKEIHEATQDMNATKDSYTSDDETGDGAGGN